MEFDMSLKGKYGLNVDYGIVGNSSYYAIVLKDDEPFCYKSGIKKIEKVFDYFREKGIVSGNIEFIGKNGNV